MKKLGINLDGSLRLLSDTDKKIINKRGFIIKRILSNNWFFKALFSHNISYIIGGLLLGVFIIFSISVIGVILDEFQLIPMSYGESILSIFNSTYWILYCIGIIIIPLITVYKYTLFSTGIFTDNSIIINNSIYSHLPQVPSRFLSMSTDISNMADNLYDKVLSFPYGREKLSDTLIFIALWIISWIFFLGLFTLNSIVFLLGKIIEYTLIHTLSFRKFIYFGEKIQKLTPTIESKSKEIQENFVKDMNFRVLSEGFDALSSTFSEIVRLVIKLEKIEKKANKGNLFDSEKYIHSLRGDIVEPLRSLKVFLEGQRERLKESQKELQKVQVKVGGHDEFKSESELSSKRGESLMFELEENIGKLEEMIEKIS